MDEKKIIAMAVAAIAEETGEDIHTLRVVSFRKVVKSGLAQYLEKNHINYTKYQLRRRIEMSKYRIKMDGVVYEMEIEKIDGEVKTAQAAVKTETVQKTAPVAVNTVSTPVKENKTTVSAPAGNGAVVVSPMPGTILKINYHNGDAVKKNDTVMILEAMKMENEIVAPQDGVVSGLAVEEKTSVQGGDVLFTVI